MTTLSEAQLKDILKANPDIIVCEAVVHKRPPIAATFEADGMTAQFLAMWKALGGPELQREYRFHESRRWRFDFAHLETKIALELNGGVWSAGRHVRGGGYLRDREKVNAAQLLGWRVVELGTGMITPQNLEPVIREMTK